MKGYKKHKYQSRLTSNTKGKVGGYVARTLICTTEPDFHLTCSLKFTVTSSGSGVARPGLGSVGVAQRIISNDSGDAVYVATLGKSRTSSPSERVRCRRTAVKWPHDEPPARGCTSVQPSSSHTIIVNLVWR